jgi:hypothetical protein
VVSAGGSITLVSGYKIIISPITTVVQSGYLHGYITTTGEYCTEFKATGIPSALPPDRSGLPVAENQTRCYPNPTTGKLTIHFGTAFRSGTISATLSDIVGKTRLQEKLSGGEDAVISLNALVPGVYILVLRQGGTVATLKVMKE